MPKIDEISSTEKLLNLIRVTGGEKPERPQRKSPRPSNRENWRLFFARFLPFGKSVAIGVDLGYAETKIIKMRRLSDKKWELLDYVKIPHTPGLKLEAPELSKLLKTNLNRVIGSDKDAWIWTLVSSTQVEMRYLRIPKLPKKQIANAVFWTFKKDVPFKDEDVIFDFDLLGEISEEGQKKLEVVALVAPKKEVKELDEAFKRNGFSLAGITTVPLSIQNFFRSGWLSYQQENTCSLFVGRNWSRIDIYSKGNLVLSRGIKAGVNSMIEAIHEGMSRQRSEIAMEIFDSPDNTMTDASGSVDANEEGTFEIDHAKNLLKTVIDDYAAVPEEIAGVPITEDTMVELITPPMERMARQVERTLEHYAINFRGERISRVLVSGMAANYQPFMVYMSKQLNVPFQPMDPFSINTPVFLQPRQQAAIPNSLKERLGSAPTVGLTLSDNVATPNFLFTYKDEDKAARASFVRRAVFTSLMLIMIFLAGVCYWQENILKGLIRERMQIQATLRQYEPLVDKDLVLAKITKRNLDRKNIAKYGVRYTSMAVLSMLANSTPPDIKLIDCDLNLGAGEKKNSGIADDAEKKGADRDNDKSGEKSEKQLKINGLIFGEERKQNIVLSQYLLSLENSPLFANPIVENTTKGEINGRKFLRFNAVLDVN